MTLSRGEIIALVGAFGAVVLSAVIHVGIREWYQPDLRYEAGGYYISRDTAITSLRITNHGHSDAETAIVSVNFGHLIRDVSIDSKAVGLNISSGGVGEKSVIVTIDRIVPGQAVSIFFAIDHGGIPSDSLPTSFLTSLTYKGGLGKTGRPIWAPASLGAFAMFLITIPLMVYSLFIINRNFEPHYGRISEMIALAHKAHEDGRSREEVISLARAATANESFRGRTLREVAIRAFDAM